MRKETKDGDIDSGFDWCRCRRVYSVAIIPIIPLGDEVLQRRLFRL